MSDQLFSPQWYRIGNLHPQLRPDVRVRRQQYRGQNWHLLSGTAIGRTYRINTKAYQFVGRCDGRLSVQEIWDKLLLELGDDAPTQDEVISVLNQLDAQGLLSYEIAPDAAALAKSGNLRRKQRRKAFVNPFAMRIPLGNPTALLRRLEWLGSIIINPAMLWIWIAAVAMALSAVIVHWPELVAQSASNMGSPRFLLIAWLCYPVIKLLHELGHGLAVRRWGGEVREAGFSLLVLVPAPYVDASASAAFRDRRHRIVVGAIGIMVELAIAAVAVAVFLNVQPGLVRDVALVTAFIASVSTLLFNGNPLLAFDGYYVFSDLIDVPNLGARSRSYWNWMMVRLTHGRAAPPPPRLARGEKKWLVLYAPLSFAYRLTISVAILLWVAAHSLLLAAAASVFIVFSLLVKPVWSAIQRIRTSVPTHAGRWRIAATSAAILTGFTTIVFAVPLPHHTVAQGVVWLPEQAMVRAGTDGFVIRMAAHDGDYVSAGDALMVMEDPELLAKRDRIASRLEILLVEQYSVLISDTAKARGFEEEIDSVSQELKRTDELIDQLELRAQVDGILVMPREKDLPNTYAQQGMTLGYVLDHGEVGIRTVVPEFDALFVRQSPRAIEVRIADVPGAPMKAVLVGEEVTAATNALPSAALGTRGGGSFATDPADPDGLQVLDPVVLIDLQLPATELTRVGARAWVRFDHGPTPLAVRWHRRIRQVFLEHISPERV